MNSSALSDIRELLTTTDPRIWVGAITVIIVFGIEMVLMKKGFIFSGKKKRLEEAKTLGNVVQGKLLSTSYSDREEGKGTKRTYYSSYEYEINGKRRKKVLSNGQYPPSTVNLYYTDFPRRVFHSSEASPGCLSGVLMYLIPILAMYFVMRLLGYQPQ